MKNYFILFLIIIFASIFRFYGINYDLPYVFNVDEPYIMDKAVQVADGHLRHGVVIRGSLPYYVNGLAIKLATIINPSILKGQPTVVQAYALDKTSFYIIGRSISALYSVIEIIIVFLLGKLIFSSSVGLLAAFFTSISSLSINFAHQVTPDTALSATILTTLYLTVFAYKRQNLQLFIFAALFIGFSAAQKLTGILITPVFILLFVFSKLNLNIKNKLLIIPIFILIILFSYLLSYPFLFLDLNKIIYEWLWENKPTAWWGELIIRDIGLIGRINKYIFQSLHFGTGTLLLLLGFVGMIQSWSKKNFLIIAFSIFPIIYLIGISWPIPNYDRWVLPLVPFVSLFVPVFIFALVKKVHFKILRFTILCPLFLLISLAPTMRSIFLIQTYIAVDTRILEDEWIKKNKIDESKILRDQYTSVRVLQNSKILTKINLVDLKNYDYFIASSYFYPRFFRQTDIYPDKAEKYQYVFNNCQRQIIFQPNSYDSSFNDFYILKNSSLLTRIYFKGPIVEIYSLNGCKLNIEGY